MDLLLYIFVITILFIIWSEYSVTNILIRKNSMGKNTLNFNSLFGFLMNPFHNRTLWTYKTLDINYAFILIYSIGIYFI